ncbi:monocarboxylate transporter 9-like isoform X1 [Stegodyphus dumicola]|uniref:monocarboxylate transporter 9-like isoform X1 n=1 Tax=Stegodyphus dumicola TaxID=202533 RepID=UPI0015ADA3A5|nr:monocarboxylate transporter 9-like isoform X1 [Stegodyphus dumicola]XP_035213358.1 monocarboxylate transporter 9-like isoform X1 [Stegodyphus dumicola]XP_035213359.1 monocarboxylate transporter 9-like isoform X1 [Stegodyphus dumicola]
MDSSTLEGRKNVDINDSNSNRTPYKTVNISDSKCADVENICQRNRTPSLSSSDSSSSSEAAVSSLPVPPDGGWGWVVVFASFMINFIADGVSLSFGILFIDFVEYFGASKAKTSWVGSIFLSMPLLAGPIASYLIDRYGCQKMCILGALLSTASFVVSIVADSLEILFLTFTVAGLGLALCYVTSIVVVAYYFEKKRSLATGLAACGTGIGTFLFPPFTIYLLEQYNWQGTLLILSGFFLNMMVFGALMRDLECPSKPNEDNKAEDSESCTLEDSERMCSSLVQLPTYLCDNLPVEVISELSSKEGGYLNSLLEQHPYILDSIMTKDETNSGDSTSNVTQNTKAKSEKKKEKRSVHKSSRKANPDSVQRESSFPGKLDAAYLRNIKVQRGSITYRGAMLNIHRYRLRASSCPDIYRNSMVTIAEEKKIPGLCSHVSKFCKGLWLTRIQLRCDLLRISIVQYLEGSSRFISKCVANTSVCQPCLFLSDLKDLMLEMFDFTIFKNVGYTLFCISNFLLYACVDVPYVYIPDHAHSSGTDMESASFLISILGVLNCLGVVIVGFIGDKPWIDSSLLYSGFILISGVSLVLLPLTINYYITASLVGIYGFAISANYTLVPVIIVNLISLDNFTGAYGLLLLVQGVASLIGPPVAGALSDWTENYDITFYCTGLCIIVSGAMVIPVAKNFLCSKSPSVSSKDSVPVDCHSMKVRFEEPEERKNSVHFENRLQELESMKEKKPIYILNDDTEKSVPLLSEDIKMCENNITKDGSKMVTMYENPLSLV